MEAELTMEEIEMTLAVWRMDALSLCMMVSFVAVGLVCAHRVRRALMDNIVREDRPRPPGAKYSYEFLWRVPLFYLFLLMAADPRPGPFLTGLIVSCATLWLLSAFCAILQKKTSSGMTWRQCWEECVMRFYREMDCLRACLLKCRDRLASCCWCVKVALVCIYIMAGTYALATNSECLIFALTLLLFLAGFFLNLCSAIHSCGKLLVFLTLYGFLFAFFAMHFCTPTLQDDLFNGVVLYAGFVVLFSLFWIFGALVADQDVARMACSITNTITTILLLASNVFISWCVRTLALGESVEPLFNEILYQANLILLPLVAAGYLTALLVEGRTYCVKLEKKKKEAIAAHLEKKNT